MIQIDNSYLVFSLQKEHIPSEGSSTSAPNAPLYHLNEIHKNPGLIDKADKTKITVEVKGLKFVSVQRNGKVVNITTDFAVGAVALYSVDKDNEFDLDFEQIEYKKLVDQENASEVDDSLETMEELCMTTITVLVIYTSFDSYIANRSGGR